MVLWHIANGDNRFSILKKKISDITEKITEFSIKLNPLPITEKIKAKM